MTKKPLIIFISLFLFFKAFGQMGTILRDKTFKSTVLWENVFFDIFLPPQYDSTKTYPVIYYLHWFGGDNAASYNFMYSIENEISMSRCPAPIIVAPDAKTSWFIDDFAGKYKFSTMFIQEFMPWIKNQYHVTDNASKTAITGVSMGGFGALRFALLYPEKFGVCVAFMAGMSTKEQIVMDNAEDYKTYHQELYGKDLLPSERANEHFMANNPIYVAQKRSSETLSSQKWFFQVCSDDYHYLPNIELHETFLNMKVPHEFEVFDGGHDDDCVNNSWMNAIQFINDALMDKSVTP